MVDAVAILGSCMPGALLARSTPGIDVVWMAMLPFLATTVPAAGMRLAAAAAVPESEFAVSGVPVGRCALLVPMLRLEEEPAVGAAPGVDAAMASVLDAEAPAGEID